MLLIGRVVELAPVGVVRRHDRRTVERHVEHRQRVVEVPHPAGGRTDVDLRLRHAAVLRVHDRLLHEAQVRLEAELGQRLNDDLRDRRRVAAVAADHLDRRGARVLPARIAGSLHQLRRLCEVAVEIRVPRVVRPGEAAGLHEPVGSGGQEVRQRCGHEWPATRLDDRLTVDRRPDRTTQVHICERPVLGVESAVVAFRRRR